MIDMTVFNNIWMVLDTVSETSITMIEHDCIRLLLFFAVDDTLVTVTEYQRSVSLFYVKQ